MLTWQSDVQLQSEHKQKDETKLKKNKNAYHTIMQLFIYLQYYKINTNKKD
jgi:hypothetical protein